MFTFSTTIVNGGSGREHVRIYSVAIYVYANLNGDTKYVGTNDIVFNGTWSSGVTYSPPMDAVNYGSSLYVVLIANSGSAPISSAAWSELVLFRADPNPPNTDLVAEQALDLANQAYTLACIGTNVGTNALELAQQALSQSAASAYNLASIGTNVGTNALHLAQQAIDGLNGALQIVYSGTNLALEALSIAVAGTNNAAAAQFTANSAKSGVDSVYPMAVAGTNLAAAAYALAIIGTNTSAVSAYNLASIGTNVGTNALNAAAAAQFSANSAIGGVNGVTVMSMAGTNLANEALFIAIQGTNLAREALAIATDGTNIGREALAIAIAGTNAAAAAQFSANSAISGVNGVTVMATAGTNLAQSAYNLAAIGTNIGSNAYAIAQGVASGVSAGAAYALASIGTNVGTNALTIALSGSALAWYGSNEYQVISSTGTDPNALGLQPFDIAKAALFITEPATNNINDYKWSTVNRTWLPFRVKLTSSFTFFVRTDGSDANTGLLNTAAGAWATIQHAVDYIVQTLIIPGSFTVTVQLADGTYAENVSLQTVTGGGTIIINGNSSTPSNVSIAPVAGDAITAAKPSTGWQIQNLRLSAANGNAIATSFGGVVVVGPGLVFAAAKVGGFHMIANNNSAILLSAAAYSITGGTGNHYYATRGSVINSSISPAVTITGSPTFTAFAAADDTGTVAVFGATFSGSVTGKRYDANLNGVIHTLSGASATYFPGTVSGTTANGGQYQ